MENLKTLLGKKATDSVTGFTGTITAITNYLSGDVKVCIEPSVNGNNNLVEEWFDIGRVDISISENHMSMYDLYEKLGWKAIDMFNQRPVDRKASDESSCKKVIFDNSLDCVSFKIRKGDNTSNKVNHEDNYEHKIEKMINDFKIDFKYFRS